MKKQIKLLTILGSIAVLGGVSTLTVLTTSCGEKKFVQETNVGNYILSFECDENTATARVRRALGLNRRLDAIADENVLVISDTIEDDTGKEYDVTGIMPGVMAETDNSEITEALKSIVTIEFPGSVDTVTCLANKDYFSGLIIFKK